jgi:hypothetical protein
MVDWLTPYDLAKIGLHLAIRETLHSLLPLMRRQTTLRLSVWASPHPPFPARPSYLENPLGFFRKHSFSLTFRSSYVLL